MLDTTYFFQRTPGSRQSEVEGGNSVKVKEIQKVRKRKAGWRNIEEELFESEGKGKDRGM